MNATILLVRVEATEDEETATVCSAMKYRLAVNRPVEVQVCSELGRVTGTVVTIETTRKRP